MSLSEIFQRIISMSYMGSIVAGIIILTKALVREKFSAKWHYYIWFLLLIRLVIPHGPESAFSVFNLIPQTPMGAEMSVWPNENSREYSDLINGQGDEENTPDMHAVWGPDETINTDANFEGAWYELPNLDSVIGVLSVIWLAGALIFIFYTIGGYCILLRKLKVQPQCRQKDVVGILNKNSYTVGVDTVPDIIYYPEAKVPALVGYLKPKILIAPDMLKRLSSQELEYIFLHEMAHQRRRDILINWIMIFIQALHWFNPIVWYAFNKMRQDCEIFCDADVLSHLEPAKRKQYGETIINLLVMLSKPCWIPGTVGMATNKSEIKRRIVMIKMFKKAPLRWTIIAMVTIALIGAIGLTNAKGLAQDTPSAEKNIELEEQVQEQDRTQTSEESTEQTTEEQAQSQDTVDENVDENAEENSEAEAAQTSEQVSNFPQEPKVVVEVDMELVEGLQKQVDEGHSPWQLSPYAVTQTFVSLQIYPNGVEGEFPIDMEDMKIIHETDAEAIVEVSGDVTPIRRVYLKRLVKQDENGIWTVVGYDPVESK